MVKDTTTYILTHFSDDDDDIDILKKVRTSSNYRNKS